MVRSGLKEPRRPAGLPPNENYIGVPRVDHYWLCAHLVSAIILYSLLLWGSFNHLASHSLKLSPLQKYLHCSYRLIRILVCAIVFETEQLLHTPQ
ncbi:hypothetical protein Smp_033370 [Schistosoma mansoni]|uniref:hypothetical protein n=1 Tax=Schistosoma mansoni TaxID=6183 RepID=UPI0001A638C8|nr:hypothetical protein Smp_033370 [Schistosoma mansoni]|eukprot:XP_018644221.1 hypothetical protein Smp_033370 [Schistosoma mansoni]